MGAGKTDAKTAMRHLGRYHGFKKPTLEEREHHFLWRVKRQLPPPGIIGVFDRSHYEDVGVVRVHELVPPKVWSCRYGIINRFEEKLVASGTRVVKCFLHISREEQKRRLVARSTTQRNAGSTIPPMSMNALTGTIISGRTQTHSRNVTARPHHGMSYPPTVGGTAIGRSPKFSPSSSRRWPSPGQCLRVGTSRPNVRGWQRTREP